MKRFLSLFLIVATISKSALGVSFKAAPELEKVFKEQNVAGTFVLYDVAADTMLVGTKRGQSSGLFPRLLLRLPILSSVWMSAR